MILLPEGSTPAAPGSGVQKLYAKSDGTMARQSSTGGEKILLDSATAAALASNNAFTGANSFSKTILGSKGATLTPAANTLTLDATGDYFTVAAVAFNNIATSGGSTCTGARTAAGFSREVTIEFEGAALITAGATLRLPGADASGTNYGVNITTYPGLVLRFREESANNWRCIGGVEICPRFETHKTGGDQNPTGGGTNDLVTWDTPTVNTNGTWGSNTFTATIPGIYDIVGEFLSFLVSGDTMDALIYINGAQSALDRQSCSISSIYLTQSAKITVSLAVGDTVKIYAALSSTRTTQFIRGVETTNNQFTIVKRKMF